MLWKIKNFNLEKINERSQDSAVSHLEITVTDIHENGLKGTMPVNQKTVQPYGILHGGSSCLLAETLGSIAANLAISDPNYVAVGQSINASHLRPATKGHVTGEATPVHIGKSSQVWQIDITNEAQELICVSRLTLAIIKRPTTT